MFWWFTIYYVYVRWASQNVGYCILSAWSCQSGCSLSCFNFKAGCHSYSLWCIDCSQSYENRSFRKWWSLFRFQDGWSNLQFKLCCKEDHNGALYQWYCLFFLLFKRRILMLVSLGGFLKKFCGERITLWVFIYGGCFVVLFQGGVVLLVLKYSCYMGSFVYSYRSFALWNFSLFWQKLCSFSK